MEKLALCIPAYNAEEYLSRLLTSAKSQNIQFDEILVYNDCSDDNTAKIAEEYGAILLNGKVNKGCSFGKNEMAKYTKCEWIHFHDADDDLMPDFTELVHNWIKNYGNRYEVLLLNYKYVDFATKQVLGFGNYNVTELHKDALRYAINNKIVNFGVYNKAAFLKAGGFDLDEYVLYNEDNAFHQHLGKQGYRFDYLPEITCINYRYNKSMSSSNSLKCAIANYYVLAKTATSHGSKYPFELSKQLWICVDMLAAHQCWIYVRKALVLSEKLGNTYNQPGNFIFKVIVKANPFWAIWLREKIIRTFKPYLRK
ncbi:MAG: glycosyltransferase [Mucilaginibacter sp.]|uniref:glycosyltransferase family 2 protein n=1 Tax=Mucilaginibacter sp. TaxID=1882438 RepID=UPI0031ABBA29